MHPYRWRGLYLLRCEVVVYTINRKAYWPLQYTGHCSISCIDNHGNEIFMICLRSTKQWYNKILVEFYMFSTNLINMLHDKDKSFSKQTLALWIYHIRSRQLITLYGIITGPLCAYFSCNIVKSDNCCNREYSQSLNKSLYGECSVAMYRRVTVHTTLCLSSNKLRRV